MARSRSRSPVRHRRKSRSRSRDRDKERERMERRRHRSRSISPRRRRSRSPRRRSRSPRKRSRSHSRGREEKKGAVPKFLLERKAVTAKELEGKSEEEQDMLKLMGFSTFDTTKGKHVPGNHVAGVHVIHKRKYRQYMNRKGGFNRPLDFVA